MASHGMQKSFAALILLSLSISGLLIEQAAAFQWSSSLSGSYEPNEWQESISLGSEEMRRRSLLQAPAPGPSSGDSGVYIGYGVLTSGYVPCPPQSGRSYYTADCQSATGPVQPYTRGCSAITLCTRGGDDGS